MNHHLPLHTFAPQDTSEGGYRLRVTKANFPALQNMSFYKVILHPFSVREPHWHANANELGYCCQGRLLISLFGNHNARESFIVSAGEAFFIPSGALHAVENIGEQTAEIVLQFSHEEPEDFDLSSVFGMFSDAVLGNTWDVASRHFQKLKRPSKKSLIAKMDHNTPLSKEMHYTSAYQFALEASAPLIGNHGGTARVARQNVWPVLQHQALYSLRLNGSGMREPHWHPETAEMGYVAKGEGKMSLMSPSGKVDTYLMQQGDLYFIPKAYPHHIENLRTDELHLLIFFDQQMPQDIGFTASVKSFSENVLSATLQCEQELISQLPMYYEDLFIVEKKNPLDA